MITLRTPDNSVYQDLLVHEDKFETLLAIGDCEAPSTFAAAVYAPLYRRKMPGLD